MLKNWKILKNQKTLLANSLSALWEELIQKTQAADKQGDMTYVAKAAALCHGIKQKEKELENCCHKITDLEEILNNQ